MPESKLTNIFLEQSNDLIWIIDSDFRIKYANQAYQNAAKQETGDEKKMNEPIFAESSGDDHTEKWKAYYERGLKGEQFEIEEHVYNPHTNQVDYSQISFKPITDDNQVVVNVACQSRDITNLKVADKKLAESETFLNEAQRLSKIGYWNFDFRTDKLTWSHELYNVFDTDKKTFIETHGSFVHLIDENDRPLVLKTSKHSQETGESFNIQYQITTTKGEKRIIEEFGYGEKDKDGKVIRLFGTAQNVTERWNSEQRFKAIVQEGSDLIAILDEAGIYTYVSPTSLSILGIKPEEFIGKSPFDYIHPEDAEKTLNSLGKIANESRVEVEPFRFQNKNGEWQWIETVLTNMLDNPSVKGIVANSRDITAKKKETQHLKLLETVVTNANDIILITEAEPLDEPGPRILYVNEAFTRMTGYTAEEVIGKSPRILQGPNSNKEELAKLGRALRNWETYEITTINYKKGGEEFWINFTVTPVANEKGWCTHWIAIERDVTEQKNKALEKELINTISDIFHQSIDNDLKICLSNLCEYITQIGDFDLAEVWMPAIDSKSINRIADCAKGIVGSVFYQLTQKSTSCALGEGLPGYVWKNKTTEIWGDIEGEWLVKSKVTAEKEDIATMIGLPLIHQDEVIGVLLLGTAKTKSGLAHHIDVLEKLKLTIASELSRKKIEIELAQIFDFTPDLICVAGFDGYIKRMNPAGLAMLGYSLEEMQSRPINFFIYEQDQLLTQERRQKLHKGENLQNFENRYVTKQGKIIWLSWTSTSLPEQGVVYAIAKNITEEKNLRELNRQVGELAKIGSWEFDAINNTVYWSNEVHQIYGTDPNSFVPSVQDAIKFYREDFRELAQSSFENCIVTQEPYSIEAVIVNLSKKEVWVRTTAKAEFIDGVCTRVYGSFQDIDELKTTESIKNSLFTTLEKSLNEVYVFDAETLKFSYVNKGALINLGYTEQEIKELTPLDLKPDYTKKSFNQLIAPLISNDREKIIFFTNHQRKNGSLYPVEVHLQLVVEGNNKRFLAVILDITDLKETEKLLESASKLARVGSWELILLDNEEHKMFWSSMIKSIVEIDESFEPTLADGINLHKEPSRTLIATAVNKAIETGEAFDLELELMTVKGNSIWVRCIGDTQLENGKVTRIFGSYQDINTRKLAELNQLKLIEEKSNILESISDYFYAIDSEFNFTYMNSSCANFLAVNKEKILGKNLFTEFPDLKNTQFEDELIKVKNTAEATKFEFNFAPFDTWFDESIYPTPNGISVYFVDITQRKKASEEIAKSEEKRRLIMNGALDAIISIDTNETITFWNAQAEVIFGWKSEEVIGKPLSETIIPEPFRKYHVEGLKNYLQTGEGKAINVLLELSAIRRNKEEFPIELTVIPIKQGGEEFFCAFIRDITQRKKEESARIMAEKNYLELFDKSNDAIYIHDIDTGQLLDVNYRATELTGFDKADILDKDASIFFTDNPEYSMEKAINNIQKAALGNPQIFEWLVKKKDGTSGWFEMTLKRTTIAGVDKVLAFQRDISERKRSEEKLIESEQKYRLLALQLQLQHVHLTNAQEVAKVGSWETDLSNLKLTWSDETYRIFGTDRESFEPTHGSFLNYVHPDDREKVDLALADSTHATTQTQHKIEHRILTASGELKVVEEKWKVTFGDKGEPLLAVGSCQDITERKKAEETILRVNERFEKVTEATNDAIWDWDILSNELYWGGGFKSQFGYDPEKYSLNIERTMELIHPDDRERVENSLNQALEVLSENYWSEEYRFMKSDETYAYVLDKGLIMRDLSLKPFRVVGAITDLSKQKRTEIELLELNKSLEKYAIELERSNQELEQFAFISSHDLQEPLRMISSFMELLKNKYSDRLDEKGLQYIHFASDGAKRMKQIILDLLQYSRANKPSQELEEVDLNEILSDFTQLRKKVIVEKSVVINSDQLPILNTHKAPITQLFHGVLDNAIKYAKPDISSSINIRVKEKHDEWEFSIEDNGIGIDEEFYEKIFGIFQRLHNREQYEGTGIGLAIAKRSAEFLGGTIWVSSTLGEGSTFYFTIKK